MNLPEPQAASPQQLPAEIKRMFNAIAPTYDTLNHLLSFGLDIRWRRKAISFLRQKDRGVFLDIAAGSGDVSIDLLRLDPQRIIAVDFAVAMLSVFRQKMLRTERPAPIELVASDALALPFHDELFDGTIVAFGIRNFADRLRSLKEMRRVLKTGGTAVILELSTPQSPVIAQLYTAYSRIGLPLLGKIISRHASAYTYLPTSIAAFPERAAFLQLMEEAGFCEVASHPLTFGAATIYVGRK